MWPSFRRTSQHAQFYLFLNRVWKKSDWYVLNLPGLQSVFWGGGEGERSPFIITLFSYSIIVLFVSLASPFSPYKVFLITVFVLPAPFPRIAVSFKISICSGNVLSLLLSAKHLLSVRHSILSSVVSLWPPLWSSGQSSWLQIRRPGFDSRHYQKKSSRSETGSTQPREYNWGATW
jgi:hypothetical protein